MKVVFLGEIQTPKIDEQKVLELEKDIYARLVVIDFFQEQGLPYSVLKEKARESAIAFFS